MSEFFIDKKKTEHNNNDNNDNNNNNINYYNTAIASATNAQTCDGGGTKLNVVE